MFVIWHLKVGGTAIPPKGNPARRDLALCGPFFLPWHRLMFLFLEGQRQRVLKDKTFGLPYWDWSVDGDNGSSPAAPIWGPAGMGGQGIPGLDGPFAYDSGDPNTFTVRIESDSHGKLARANGGQGGGLSPVLDHPTRSTARGMGIAAAVAPGSRAATRAGPRHAANWSRSRATVRRTVAQRGRHPSRNAADGSFRAGHHVWVSPIDSVTDDLQDLAVLWSMGEIRAHDVVESACAALVSGWDSHTLRILAGFTRAEAEYEVPDLLPVVLDELGLVFYPRDSEAGQEAFVRALACQMLAGRLTPRELALRIHQRFGHQLPLAESFSELDDEYDIVEYGDRTSAQLDAEVTAQARRLAYGRPDHNRLS
ncbi:tyrosinase family protein [Streptomyces sp. NPDC002690]